MFIRKKVLVIDILLILGYFLMGTVWAENVKFVEAKIKKDFVIGGDSDNSQHILSDPTDVKVYNGKLYVLDSKVCCINIYDCNNGRYISAFSGKGSGPKELLNPSGFAIVDKNVFIANKGNSRIDIFDLDGVYKGSFKLFQQPNAICSDSRGNLLILYKQDNCLVHKYSADGKLIKSMVPSSKEKDMMIGMFMDMVSIVMAENDEFFIVSRFKNKIDKYDSNGKLIFSKERPLTFEYQSLRPTKSKDGGIQLMAKSLSWSSVYKRKVLYIMTSQGKEEENNTLVDMIDNTGKYLGSFIIPVSMGFIYFDCRNKAYIIDSDESTVTKCDLLVSGKN